MRSETEMMHICASCGLTFGSHRGDGSNRCPGHEGRMDWDQGPGTSFMPSGEYHVAIHGKVAQTRSVEG